MRKYQRIWERIKADINTPVAVAADANVHKRIVDCVRKEKNLDLGWKLLMSEQGKKYVLLYESDGSSTLLFYLEEKPIISAQFL